MEKIVGKYVGSLLQGDDLGKAWDIIRIHQESNIYSRSFAVNTLVMAARCLLDVDWKHYTLVCFIFVYHVCVGFL